MDTLFEQALRADIKPAEFWGLTPTETFAAIKAANWRAEQQDARDAWIAWHTAALVRAKRMPSLKRLMGGGQTRRLEGEELEKRRRERAALERRIDVDAINRALAKK